MGIDLHHDDHGNAHNDAGENTGHKDVAHRNAGEGRIDHKRNTGRDNDRNRGSGSHHAMCEGVREFLTLDHGGDQDNAQSCHGGRAGAGDGAEEAGHHNADHCDASAQVPQQRVNEGDQSVGDPGLRHDVAGQDEEGNGQQKILADAAIDLAGDNIDARPIIQDGQQRGHTQRQCDRCTQKQQDHKNTQHNGIRHAASPPFVMSALFSSFSSAIPSRMRSTVWITIRNAPSGINAL